MTEDQIMGGLCAVGGFCAVAFIVLWKIFLRGIFLVEPRQAYILLYWGKYSRTIEEPGIRWAFPIGLSWRMVSTRDQCISLPVTTVVEAHGNPIQVSAVCVYRIVDAAKALIDIQGYQRFVANQASVVLKTICARYPYESRDPREACLKKESQAIIDDLGRHLQAQVQTAGIQIVLVRLNDLTYAPEIAQSMLLRQQAQAMVDARRTLVEGAVATVKEGIDRLVASGLTLSEPVRNKLASNLTLLLCAGERGEQHSTVITRQRH